MTIAAIALSLALQQGPSYSIGGDKIPVQVPTWTCAIPTSTFESGGWKYALIDGSLVGKGKAGIGWEDVPATGIEGGPKLRVLFNVVTKTDAITDVGFLWQRQGNLFTDDFRAMKREVALFCHLANTLGPGKPTIEPVWRVDESTRIIESPSDLGRGYLETFMNATTAKSSDGVGPMDFTFVLNPSYDGSATYDSIDGKPAAALPVYSAFDRARPGQLARAMFNAWVRPQSESSGMADFVGAGPIPLLGESAGTLAAFEGKVPTSAGGRASQVVDGKLFVRSVYADIFATMLSRQPVGQAKGWVVFDGTGVTAGQTDAHVLGVEAEADPTGAADLPFTPGQAEQLLTSGNFSVRTSADPERGAVGEVKEMSIRRKGWLRLLGPFDGATNDSIEFWVRQRGTAWPLDLVVVGDGKTARFRMFGSADQMPLSLAEAPSETPVNLDLKLDGAWQRVAVKHGVRSVRGVFLAPPANAGSDEMARAGLPVLMLDDIAAKPNVEPTPTKILEPQSDSPYTRAATAATTTDATAMLKFLEDPSDVVRLNAAARFVTIKNPAAVPALTLIARHYNPRLAQVGAKALANQGTDAAWGALRYNFQNALGDYVKEFTAGVLPAIDDRKILSELSMAINARRPEARAAAARALAKQPFKEASLVLLTFLNDADALVRAAAIESYPEKQPTGLARIVAAARTDGSDLVRAAAFRKLKSWGAPEAADVAKDPSPRVRASVQ